jgi:hypothetical protein
MVEVEVKALEAEGKSFLGCDLVTRDPTLQKVAHGGGVYPYIVSRRPCKCVNTIICPGWAVEMMFCFLNYL